MPITQSIELQFDPDIFKKGEDLYENKAIIEIVKVNRSLYSIVIRDGKLYEVELLKPLLKGQKSTCECTFYKENKSCKHIVASLLYFKTYKEKLETDKLKKDTKSIKSKAISIKSLLNDVDQEDLKAFVQAYASNDKKFSNALKINFIRKVDLEDNEKKYKVLLDSIIRPVSSREIKLKATDLRHFKTIVKDLLEQAQDALALKEYVEASLILKTVLVKLHYIDHYYPDHFDEIKELFQGYYLIYNELLQAKYISVELKESTKDNLFELLNSSFYHSPLNLFNAAELICMNFPEEKDELIDVLNEKVNRLNLEKKELIITYALLFRLRYKSKDKSPFDLPPELTPLLEGIINNLTASGETKIAIETCKLYKSLYPGEIIYTTLVLELFIKQDDKVNFIKTVISSFKKSKDLRIIELVKKFEIEGVIDQVREEMKDNMPDKLSNYKKAELLMKLEDWEGLMAHLYQMQDIRTLMLYDKVLYKDYSEEVTYLYLQIIEKYLDQHIGDFANVFINELKMHLDKNKMSRITKKINTLVTDKYSHRNRLNDHYF